MGPIFQSCRSKIHQKNSKVLLPYIFRGAGALLLILGHVLDLALLLLNRGALILVGRLRHCPALLLVHGLALLLLKGNKSKLV